MDISSIFNIGSKEYITGIDNNGYATTQSLNFIKRILRLFLGCYPETHLEKVLPQISNKITQENFTFAQGQAFKIVNLFSKKLYSSSGSRLLYLHNITDEQGKMLTFGLVAPSECSPYWAIKVEIKNPSGANFMAKVKIAISNVQDRHQLNVTDILISTHCSHDLLNALYQNSKQFLLHILHSSSRLDRIGLNGEREVLGFPEDQIFKALSPRPVGLGDLPPLSLDFLAQLNENRAN